jgi:3-polyprenyl-4-hydroxybenzoate decarboxylase
VKATVPTSPATRLSRRSRAKAGQQLHPAERDPSDVLDHATSEIASGSKLGIDATKKLPGEGFKRPWPPLIKMDVAVKAKVEKLFNSSSG